MNTGIYKITVHDTVYYGQSANLYHREAAHRSYLRKGTHANNRLQRTYDKYEDFNFEVVLYCETSELNRYEQWFLDQYQPLEKCANVAICAEAPTRGLTRTMTDETRTKLSQAHRGKILSKAHKAKLSAAKQGRSLSEAHKATVAQSVQSRYPDITAVFRDGSTQTWPSSRTAARDLGVSYSTVRRWIHGTRALPNNIKSITTHETQKQVTPRSGSV